MSTNEPPFIRIYQSCLILMNIKRNLFAPFNIKIPLNSPEDQDKSTTASRVYICLKKIIQQSKYLFEELSLNCKKSNHIRFINNIILNLKSNSDYLTRQQKLIIQAKTIIENWSQNADPLVYYDQREREDLKALLKSKLLQIKTCAQACQESKQPLYVRKRERELKDQLYEIAEIQNDFNNTQSNLFHDIKNKMIRLITKILQATNNRQKNSFTYDQRTLLLSKYIDLFQLTSKIGEKQVAQYRKDLMAAIRNILHNYRNQHQSFQKLSKFLYSVQQEVKNFNKEYSKVEDQIAKQISDVSPNINHIVGFEDILETVSHSKKYAYSLLDWSQFSSQISSLGAIMVESLYFTQDYLKSIQKRAIGNKNIYIQHFIQDKKFLQNLSKKAEIFQSTIFLFFKKLLQSIYRSSTSFGNNGFQKQGSKKRKFEKALVSIFQNYFKQTERKAQAKSTDKQQNNLSISQQNQFNKIQNFVQNLHIFQKEQNMDDCFNCSLGPRLLIHGRMKMLNKGILYISSFNKKNLFFGKTKLFIDKEEIIEINKESALVIFPDVIEVVTKKGGLYFHALGKRQRMYQQLNSYYFPEANSNQTINQQVFFKEFKGQRAVYEARISSYLSPLQNELTQGQIPNLTLRNFFHTYYSDQEFFYHSESYKCFSYYSIKTAGGTSVEGNTYTPGIPYYFQPRKSKEQTENDIHQSERFFTYKKEVPTILFVSKGGFGICQQKNVCRWGSPYLLVIDIFSTLSGFSLTQGMLVKARLVFQEKSNSLHYKFSGQVTFQTASTINALLRGPALSALKGFLEDLYQKIKKIQRCRKVLKVTQKKDEFQKQSQLQLKIQYLSQENMRLKKMMKISISATVLLFTALLILYILK